MSVVSKATTLLRLLAQGDWLAIRSRWLYWTAPGRVRRHGGKPFVHRDPGFPAICHPDWPDSLGHFLNGEGDHWEISLLQRWLRAGDAAVDVGANTGLYSFALADSVGPQGQVLAVDADPFIVEKLRVAAALLGASQLRPLHAALADQTGSLTFYVRADRSVTTEQSLRPSDDLKDICTAVTIPALSLTDLVGRLDPGASLAAIKIDIEGAEAMAMQAVPSKFLTGDGPFWLVEINPGALARFGATPVDVTGRFCHEHFDRWVMPKHPISPPSGGLTIRPLAAQETFADSVYYNLLAIPRGPRWQPHRRAISSLLKCGK